MRFIENEISFSNIYIIQSLDINEKQTGQLLFEDIFKPLMYKPQNWICELLDFESKDELKTFLSELIKIIEMNIIVPHLHFECHGSETGLHLRSGECITWKELERFLLKINIATKNNLFISVASCYGGFIQNSLKIQRQPCPFRAFIGPKGEIKPDKVLTSFSVFFECLLSDKSYDSALEAISLENPEIEFEYVRAEQIFDSTIEKSTKIQKNLRFVQNEIKILRAIYLHYE